MMIYDGKYEIYDGKIRLDMLISNGVLLIFPPGPAISSKADESGVSF